MQLRVLRTSPFTERQPASSSVAAMQFLASQRAAGTASTSGRSRTQALGPRQLSDTDAVATVHTAGWYHRPHEQLYAATPVDGPCHAKARALPLLS